MGRLQEEYVDEDYSTQPLPTIDLQAERERKRELARQRKARQREREKQESSSNIPSDSGTREADRPRFTLKGALGKSQEEVKLVTKQEAEEQIDKLVFLYMRGSELLDDVLEIVVKGHEKVQIWALAEDEAKMLAEMQMERAKKEKAAARVVRAMVNIYDRMYFYMLIGPRLYKTGHHIKDHGGISFK